MPELRLRAGDILEPEAEALERQQEVYTLSKEHFEGLRASRKWAKRGAERGFRRRFQVERGGKWHGVQVDFGLSHGYILWVSCFCARWHDGHLDLGGEGL